MKKLIILLIIILGLSLIAYAGATKEDLVKGPGAVGIHVNASGFVIINETPEGDTTTVVQIQVRDAAANCTYYVRSNAEPRGSFTTNKKGSGHFHLNLSPLDPELGPYIAIRSEYLGDNTTLVLVFPAL